MNHKLVIDPQVFGFVFSNSSFSFDTLDQTQSVLAVLRHPTWNTQTGRPLLWNFGDSYASIPD